MSATILDGKAIAADMREELKEQAASLTGQGVTPGLGVLLVGEDPASRSYVTAKEKACEKVGLYSAEKHLPQDATREQILEIVEAYNADDRIHGILVQLPLPDRSIEDEVINTIRPEIDVDGFHPVNIGRMLLGQPAFLSCTPHGILQILHRTGHAPAGKHVVIVGRSNIVGRPLANMLIQKSELGNATVTVCHTRTPDIAEHTRRADIVIAAAGLPKMITADMVGEGAVVIDVGVNRVEDASAKRGYRLVGDCDFEALKDKVQAITPVPGGVGPMTITMLLYNTIESASRVAARM